MQLMLQLILLVCFAFKVASFMPIVRSISQPIRNCPIKLISFHKWRIQQLKRYSSTLSNGDQILYVPVSFYNFIKYNETELKEIESRAFEYLESLPALGTLLLASEGYNAQLTFPESKVDHFSSTIRDVLRDPQLNLNMGKSYLVSDQRAKEQFPYKKLMVKRKPKVLTDGFLDSNDASNVSFDWSKNNGIELPPELWHQEISAASSDSNKDDSKSKVLILDCRNDYESSVGTFKNAIPLNTTKFSESWDKLDELLKDTPKDVKLLTFCTGGIRCVKVGGYLQQKLGFENVFRLEKGIINYEGWHEKQLNDDKITDVSEVDDNPTPKNVSLPSVFIGKNYLFDRRRDFE